jgi:DNA-binding transcriptional ArsR family regulator
MNITNYNPTADLFKILSHPVRLQILDEVRFQPCCVCHLQVLTGRPQAYISQQLRVLRDAGLVADDKDGQNVYYQLSNPTVDALLHEVFGPTGIADRLEGCCCPKCNVKSS